MAETAILNANIRWDKSIDDAIGPDYGWQRLRASQLAVVKPAFGAPYTRTVGNGGHTTSFSWTNRSRKCIEKLKQFAEQYEDGYFTVIDHDGGGRHYVGRFVGDMPLSQAGNDRWNIQGWQFEEIPGAAILKYPDNWDSWAVIQRPFFDDGSLRVAVNSANWTRPAAVADDFGVLRQPNQLSNLNPTGGDTCTFEYRGYGFRVWAAQNPGAGLCNIAVDGVAMGALNLTSEVDNGIAVVYENTAMPLDVHRVTLTMTATKALTSSQPNGLLLDRFEVMR